MKTLAILSTSGIGGTETFIVSTAPYLRKHGCEVEIMNITIPNPLLKRRAEEQFLTYHELPAPDLLSFLKNIFKIIRMIKKNRYDIIFCFGIRVSLQLRLTKIFYKKTPIIIGIRNLDNWRKWYHTLPDRFLEPACDVFVPNSRIVAAMRNKREKTPWEKLVTIYNGIDTDFFNREHVSAVNRQSLNLPEDKLLFTTVANFRHTKGHTFLIDVIAGLRKQLSHVHFVWVGKDVINLKKDIVNRLNAEQLTENITIVDNVDDVRHILAVSDAFLLPSNEEGMPRALMEAMAMSLPCLATNVGGVSEIIKDASCGCISEFGDSTTFGNHLLRLANSSEVRSSMGEAAKECIINHFDIDLISRQYIHLFNALLSNQFNGIQLQQELDAIS